MNRVLVSGFFLLFFFKINAQTSNKITLQQAIQTAIDNNVQVRQSGLRTQVAEVNWKQAKANIFPSLNGNATHGINQGRSIDPFTNSYVDQKINYANYGLGSSVVLFNGLSLQNNIKQASLSYEASKSELQQAKDNLTINVILAYLSVLNNEDLVTQAKSQASVTKQQLDRLEVMNRQGAISPPLLAELKGQLMNDELAVVNMQNALEQSKLQLAQLMNLNYDRNMQVERMDSEDFMAKYGATVDAVYQQALDNLSMVKAAGLRTKSAEAGLKSVKGELFPTLSLNGNVSTNYSSVASQNILLNSTFEPTTDYVLLNGNQLPVISKTNNYQSQKIRYTDQLSNNLFSNVSLSLRVPIFNSFQTRNRIKLAQINIKSAQLVEENTKLQLRQAIDQAYLNMTNAEDRLKLSLEQVKAYQEAFRAAEIRFQSGVGTSVDYLVAKNNLDRSNSNLIIARYDFVLRKKILDFYSGNLH